MTPAKENVLGAIIFISYITAALTLTYLIVGDLFKLYREAQSRYAKRRRQQHILERSGLIKGFNRHLGILVASSLLSFSLLSYHMLHFLVKNYQAWTNRQFSSPEPPESSHDPVSAVLKNLWPWMKGSSLFQDFARSICADSERMIWTSTSLLGTFAFNIWMSIEGMLGSGCL